MKGLSAAESNQVYVFLFRLKTIIRAMVEPYTPHDVNTQYLIPISTLMSGCTQLQKAPENTDNCEWNQP